MKTQSAAADPFARALELAQDIHEFVTHIVPTAATRATRDMMDRACLRVIVQIAEAVHLLPDAKARRRFEAATLASSRITVLIETARRAGAITHAEARALTTTNEELQKLISLEAVATSEAQQGPVSPGRSNSARETNSHTGTEALAVGTNGGGPTRNGSINGHGKSRTPRPPARPSS